MMPEPAIRPPLLRLERRRRVGAGLCCCLPDRAPELPPGEEGPIGCGTTETGVHTRIWWRWGESNPRPEPHNRPVNYAHFRCSCDHRPQREPCGNSPHGVRLPGFLGGTWNKLLFYDGDASQQKRTLHITGSRREGAVEVAVVCSYCVVCCFRRDRRSPRAPDGFADSVETRHPRFRTVKKGVLLRQRVHLPGLTFRRLRRLPSHAWELCHCALQRTPEPIEIGSGVRPADERCRTHECVFDLERAKQSPV